jgi:hypothetical protein
MVAVHLFRDESPVAFHEIRENNVDWCARVSPLPGQTANRSLFSPKRPGCQQIDLFGNVS